MSNTNKRSWTERVNEEFPNGLWTPDMLGNRMVDCTKYLIDWLSSESSVPSKAEEPTKDQTISGPVTDDGSKAEEETLHPDGTCKDTVNESLRTSPTEVPEQLEEVDFISIQDFPIRGHEEALATVLTRKGAEKLIRIVNTLIGERQ